MFSRSTAPASTSTPRHSSFAATMVRFLLLLLWLITTNLLSLSSEKATPFASGFNSAHYFSVPRPYAEASWSTQTSTSVRRLLKITSVIPIPTSALQYASRNEAHNSGGPMSQVDSTKSGGCPFLDTSYIYKTYAIPALFSESGM